MTLEPQVQYFGREGRRTYDSAGRYIAYRILHIIQIDDMHFQIAAPNKQAAIEIARKAYLQ